MEFALQITCQCNLNMIFCVFYNYYASDSNIVPFMQAIIQVAITDDTDLKGLEISNWNCIYQHFRACSSNHLKVQMKYNFLPHFPIIDVSGSKIMPLTWAMIVFKASLLLIKVFKRFEKIILKLHNWTLRSLLFKLLSNATLIWLTTFSN